MKKESGFKMKGFSGFKASPVKAADKALLEAAKKMGGSKEEIEVRVAEYIRQGKSDKNLPTKEEKKLLKEALALKKENERIKKAKKEKIDARNKKIKNN